MKHKMNFKELCLNNKFDFKNDFKIVQYAEVFTILPHEDEEIVYFGKSFIFGDENNDQLLKQIRIGQIKQEDEFDLFGIEKGYGEYYGGNLFYQGQFLNDKRHGEGRQMNKHG